MLHAPIEFLSSTESTTFTVNVQTSLNANWQGGDPYYISVDAVDGLNSADISFESHPIPNMTGEVSGDVFRRGKSIALTGTIWGRNYGSLGVAAEYLSQMFWETEQRKLRFYPLVNASAKVYIMCRVNQDLAVVQSKPQDTVYRWAWTVGLRADSPIIYNESDDTVYKSWMI